MSQLKSVKKNNINIISNIEMSIKDVTISIQKDVIESIFNSLEVNLTIRTKNDNNTFNAKVKDVSKVIRVKTINMNEIRKTKNLFSAQLKNMFSKKPIVLTV